eukprot:6198339-Pleurochrysis_carterae.AAC.1
MGTAAGAEVPLLAESHECLAASLRKRTISECCDRGSRAHVPARARGTHTHRRAFARIEQMKTAGQTPPSATAQPRLLRHRYLHLSPTLADPTRFSPVASLSSGDLVKHEHSRLTRSRTSCVCPSLKDVITCVRAKRRLAMGSCEPYELQIWQMPSVRYAWVRGCAHIRVRRRARSGVRDVSASCKLVLM